MTNDTWLDDIIQAIMSGNVAMNRDVSLVIAGFTRDFEIKVMPVCLEIQGTRFESVVWKEFREHTVYPKVCEAAIEHLSRRDTRATRYPVVYTSIEFDLLLSALKLHAKNEYIQRNGFELLYSSLLSMERSRAVHLGEERMRFIYSQMAFVVCRMFTNLAADSSRSRFVAIIGINQLQRDEHVDTAHLRAFHVGLLESHFLLLALSLLEQCVTSTTNALRLSMLLIL